MWVLPFNGLYGQQAQHLLNASVWNQILIGCYDLEAGTEVCALKKS